MQHYILHEHSRDLIIRYFCEEEIALIFAISSEIIFLTTPLLLQIIRIPRASSHQ